MAKTKTNRGIASAAIILAIAATSATAGQWQSLNDAWQFHLGQARGADQPAFNKKGWQLISLPHTWNNKDGQDGNDDYIRGPAWYRRQLTLEENATNKRVFIRFGAANSIADVYINGHHAGTHAGGYSAFCFEITKYLHGNKPNTIAVKVNNAHNEHIAPFSADYTFFGGLYRGAELLITDQICISPLDYASNGLYLRQSTSRERADIELTTIISNGHKEDHSITISTAITDATGKEIANTQSTHTIPPGEHPVTQQITITNPHLWDGRNGPHLYTVHLQAKTDDNTTDEITENIGLRFFHVDPAQGFFLNGRHYDLHGVNRHQDRLDKGWAIGLPEHEEDMALIHEMGCTAVRLAHYQQAPEVYSICDRLGLVVWAEIPVVNRIVDSKAFTANVEQQMRELIRQNFNHPSIICWGVQNEVTASWAPGPDPTNLIAHLAKLAKQEDSTRLTVCAGTDPLDHPANWQTDLIAFNRYFGWYWGDSEMFGPWADKMHDDHPDRPIGISEFGAGASINHHQATPNRPRHDGNQHPEEWQAHLHEVHWRAMAARPYLWCKFVWNMFDFASDGRREGDAPGRNDKGLVTYDRKTPKDAFYWYKANWNPEPMVYITSKRFTQRTEPTGLVKIYSNCPTVKLELNGIDQGPPKIEDKIFTWPKVQLTPGPNTLQATAPQTDTHNQTTTTDTCTWTFEPKSHPRHDPISSQD